MTDTQIRNQALTEKIYGEIVGALAQEFVPLFTQTPTLKSITWFQDPQHYNDEINYFAAFTEPYQLGVNGIEGKTWVEDEEADDKQTGITPELKTARKQASEILNAFDERLLAWLNENAAMVTLTREGVTFDEPSRRWR
jgi:hypothetical protein